MEPGAKNPEILKPASPLAVCSSAWEQCCHSQEGSASSSAGSLAGAAHPAFPPPGPAPPWVFSGASSPLDNTHHEAGPRLINANIYRQLMACQDLMSPSKPPYGADTVVTHTRLRVERCALREPTDTGRRRPGLGFTCTAGLLGWAGASLRTARCLLDPLNPANVSAVFAPLSALLPHQVSFGGEGAGS